MKSVHTIKRGWLWRDWFLLDLPLSMLARFSSWHVITAIIKSRVEEFILMYFQPQEVMLLVLQLSGFVSFTFGLFSHVCFGFLKSHNWRL